MTVTSVRVNLDICRRDNAFRSGGSVLIGFGSITLDNSLVIDNIRVIRTSEKRMIVAMPSLKKNDGSFKDVAYPVTQGLRDHIADQVLLAVETRAKEMGKTTETLA